MSEPGGIVKNIIAGERTMADLISHFQDRDAALRCYAAEAQALFPGHPLGRHCQACGRGEAASCIVLTWTAMKSFNWKSTLGVLVKAVALFPFIVLCQLLLPLFFLPDVIRTDMWLSFFTTHNICNKCRSKLRHRGILAGAVMVLFGVILVFSFGAALILLAFCITSALSGLGFTPQDLRLFAPLFLGALALMAVTNKCLHHISRRLTVPRALARIGRKPFAPA